MEEGLRDKGLMEEGLRDKVLIEEGLRDEELLGYGRMNCENRNSVNSLILKILVQTN
jgi:hypothetical protein